MSCLGLHYYSKVVAIHESRYKIIKTPFLSGFLRIRIRVFFLTDYSPFSLVLPTPARTWRFKTFSRPSVRRVTFRRGGFFKISRVTSTHP